jgi:hypothetical protein
LHADAESVVKVICGGSLAHFAVVENHLLFYMSIGNAFAQVDSVAVQTPFTLL